MKFGKTFASGLMLALMLAQNVAYAGIPHVAFAEETETAVTETVSEDSQEEVAEEVVDESVEEVETEKNTEEKTEEETPIEEDQTTEEEVVTEETQTATETEESTKEIVSEEEVNQTEEETPIEEDGVEEVTPSTEENFVATQSFAAVANTTDPYEGLPNTVTVDADQCELDEQNGWYAKYYNYTASHPDMELPNEVWGAYNGDPLSDTGNWEGDWYDNTYFKFSRIDTNLAFGPEFFPFDPSVSPVNVDGEALATNGHNHFFGVHWKSIVTPDSDGDYNFTVKSDDDVWVYLDGELILENDGVHPVTEMSGVMTLTTSGTHVVDIYFAERHTVKSHMYFDFTTQGVTVTPYSGEPCDNGEENMCLALVTPAGNDSALAIGESFENTEKTLETILDENGYGSVDVVADQTSYETWAVALDKSVTFEVKVLGKEAYYEDIFGIYEAGDLNTFKALGRTGNIPATTTAPLTTVGQSQVFTVEDGDHFGLAIKTYDPNATFIQTFATENTLNVDSQTDHAIVFEVADGYVVAFEDIPEGWVKDNDYNDLVLLITPISCADVPHENEGIDLDVSKTASVATTTPGTAFDYTITVSNNGPENASGVSVTDMLPVGVTFNSATSTIGSYATSTGIWTVGNLTASSTETLTINVTASSTGEISNTATATSTDGKTDNNTDNDSDTVVVTVRDGNGGGGNTGVDLAVTKTASVASTTASSTFSYTISVTNNGPETATGVEVTDVLPAGITLDSATTTAGVYTASTSVWVLDTLAPSTSETMTLTVTVASTTTGDIVNTASATSTDGKTDNNTDNNSDTVTVTVTDGNGTGGGETGIDLAVSKTASISEVSEVDIEFTYTISVTNNGPDVAEGVEVTDVLPGSVLFVSASTTIGSYATSTGIWSVGDIAPNATETLMLTVKTVSVDADIVNVATGTTTTNQVDNNPDNNTGTNTVTIPDDNTGGGGGGGGETGGGSGGSSGGSGGGTINFVGTGSGTALQCEYLKEFLRYGYNNNPVEVIKLQAFLNSFENESLAVDGFFDLSTDAAVRRFQVKYFGDILEPWGHTDSTGYVYILTKKKVNEIFCNRAFPVTSGEAQEIVEFRAFLESLRARGVDTTEFEGGIGGNMGETETDTEIADDTSTSGIRDFFDNIFGNNDAEGDLENATTTGTSTSQFATTLRNLAAAALVFPGDTNDACGCLIVLIIILAIIYVLGSLIVNGMNENKPIEVVRSRKLVAFMIGVIIAIIVAFLAPYPCIIIPLLVILVLLFIWWILRRKKTKPTEMNKEFSL